MGFISDLANSKNSLPPPGGSRDTWAQVFGGRATNKEEGFGQKPRPGGDWGRSTSASQNAFKRLLESMRSNASGTWSDDRWEQTKHFVGIGYVAMHRICEQMAQAEFNVFERDYSHPDGKRPVNKGEPGYRLIELLEKPNNDDGFGDLLYCFPAGTRVRMADGTQKPIETVRLFEEVLTAEGNFGKVKKCHVRKYEGDLVGLKLWGHGHLKMTPNHPVLTKRGYVAAGELIKGDWVRIPKFAAKHRNEILQTREHVSGEVCKTKQWYAHKSYGRSAKVVPSTNSVPWANYNKIPDFIKLTPGAGRIFGFYLAEGYAARGSSVVTWSFGTHEAKTLVAELVALLKSEFNLKASVRTVNCRNSVTLVTICGAFWVRLFRSLCGSGAKHKRVHSDLLAGPDSFLKSLFYGWMDGDGWKKKKNVYCGATVSRSLSLNMYDIANYLGYSPVIRWEDPPQKVTYIDGSPVKGTGVWKVIAQITPTISTSSKARKNYRLSDDSDCMWRKVKSTTREEYSGEVFNIGVEGDNSYVAEGIGVHNCWSQQMLLTGSALTWMVPSLMPSYIEGKGLPMELYPIPTATAVPQAVSSEEFPQGYYRIQPVYPYGPFSSTPTPNSAVGAAIPSQWMLKFKFPHPFLRYDGWSPQTALRLHLDQVEMIDRSRHYTMRRTINPAATLLMDDAEGAQPLSDEEIDRLKAEFEEVFMGPENAGRLFVGAPGWRLDQWGNRPIDMDYSNGWNQLVSFVLGGFGITKQAAGMVEDSSYSTLFATLKQLYWLTLEPLCNRIASKLTRHLAPFFGEGLIIDIRCKRIDDHDVAITKNNFLMAARALTKNEARRSMDYPLTMEPWGSDIAGVEPVQFDANGMPIPVQQQRPSSIPGMSAETEGMTDDDMIQEAMRILPSEISAERPDPGPLGQGAMGQRKVPGAPVGGSGNTNKSFSNGHRG